MLLIILMKYLIFFLSQVALSSTDTSLSVKFVGCFQHITPAYPVQTSNTLTIEWCISQCRSYNTTFAALQNGDSCWCGNDVRNSTSEYNCNTPCYGNHGQYCGGQSTLVVYTVCPIGLYGFSCENSCHCKDQIPCDVQTGKCWNACDDPWFGLSCGTIGNYKPQYFGCYIDAADRDLPDWDSTPSSILTIESCLRTCTDRGRLYAGVQAKSWCLCGNTYGKYGAALESDCSNQCSGNSSEICGNDWKNSVYSVCPSGTFGSGCAQKCHCAADSGCYPNNGTCRSNECAAGWKGSTCSDKNCSMNFHGCSVNETCGIVDEGIFQITKCSCRSGYRRNYIWDPCQDTNECSDNTSSCNILSEMCVNTVGSFYCSCLPGFIALESGTSGNCKDIDECQQRTDNCSRTAENCNNTYGSYECLCKTGFRRVNNTCTDINECLELNPCKIQLPTCTNTFGSFFCTDVLMSTHATSCTDIQEITGIAVLAALLGISILIHIAVVIYVLRNCSTKSKLKAPSTRFKVDGDGGNVVTEVQREVTTEGNSYEHVNKASKDNDIYTEIDSNSN